MPKNPLRFGRRKSTGNVLEEAELSSPATSSFRVLERPEKINLNGDVPQPRQRQVNRPFNSPLHNLRGASVEELGAGTNRSVERPAASGNGLLKHPRGSGGTTNSGSSGYYESSSASARHSSSSTLPSSVDAEKEPEDEELFPRRAKTTPLQQGVSSATDEPPPPGPSFTTRAVRALSFGQKYNKTGLPASSARPGPFLHPTLAPRSPERSQSPQRERALTTSSYASTAKPEVNLSLGTSDFGSDFSTMFESSKVGDRRSIPLPPVPPAAAFHRADSPPMFPPRAHSRNAFRNSPEELPDVQDDAGSPHGWDRRSSREGLMSSSPQSSPMLDGGPPVPPHRGAGIAPAFLGRSKNGYAAVPGRISPPVLPRLSQESQNSFLPDQKDEICESGKQNRADNQRWARQSELLNPQEPQPVEPDSPPARNSNLQTRLSSEDDSPLWASESMNTTPRAPKADISRQSDESLFDSSPVGPPSRAIKPQHARFESGAPKRMTKAQFERLQRNGGSSTDQSEEECQADEYDDDDEAERAKARARQRRKQEANMAVYRQQMKKVTGGGPSDLPSMRPGLDRASASAPAVTYAMGGLHLGGTGGQPPADAVRGKQSDDEDDDDDVPLGILQAHGFPGAGRPPTRQGENDLAAQRRTSVAGSVVGGGGGQGNLPPFARRLPADPYYGSSVVNHSRRESLGLNQVTSVYGSTPNLPQVMVQQPPAQTGHPGGLVGVIAGEERAKAARRGSPNPTTGTYDKPIAMPNNMPQMGGFPGMPRATSMGNVAPPLIYTPNGFAGNPMMPQMPLMPQMQQQMAIPQNDQMQQFMQMQMQLMQSMLKMQQQQMGQTPPPVQQPTPDYLGVPLAGNRLSQVPSIKSQQPNQGRAMSMMHPPSNWNAPPGAQRPTSAMPQLFGPAGLNIANGDGYTPSIAPSERSNIGQPSRYRPVPTGGDGGRSNSMTSSATLQTFRTPQPAPAPAPGRPQSQYHSKSTVRLIDKPKGTPRVVPKPIDEEDDDGWAEMRKKRDEKKKFRFGRKDKKGGDSLDLFQDLD